MPHDALFKALVADPARATRFLALTLPKPILDRIDLDIPATQLPGSFVTERGKQVHCDAIFELRLKLDDPRRLVILLEHKSKIDLETPVKLLQYVGEILDSDFGRQGRRWQSPAVLPVVFHHGRKNWTAANRIGSLMEGGTEAEPLGAYMRYLLLDLRHALDRYSSDPKIYAVMVSMNVVWMEQELSMLDLDHVTAGLVPGSQLEILTIDYLVELTNLDMERLESSMKRTRKENGEKDMDTLLRRMKREAVQEGLERGIERGIAKGKAEGKAESLIKLLNLRFESVPGSVIERVQRATIADLEAWFDTAVTASSIDEVIETRPSR